MARISSSNLAKIGLSWAAGGALIGGCIALGMSAHAQTIASHDTNAPVSFDAGSIDFDDRANRVVLSGNVVVNQGPLSVRSNRMLASYTDDGSLDVQRITANGGVVVTRANERASGDVAVYDFGKRIITMAGNVSLSRGGDVLRGERLVINLATGLSSVDGRASGANSTTPGDNGRVTGTFNVSGD
ncbi:OstA family protein [Erythrobacter sp. SCSIO 43205]|uniref:LptA/OstA family protein n=1 Tax=Erythrobacter sp. SCSIO 43205 TaxID=2779361 RepID=UPI001CA94069|nr:LptA/OstA family protein [Erythrobacter sp. SCSIO 43205]UAB78590.1 OstA family protein [Erythrobacter sp. SCSIO 43205]